MAGSAPLGPAATRVFRVIGLGFLPGTIAFGLLSIGPIAAQAHFQPRWWTYTAALSVLVPPFVLGCLALVAPIRLLRGLGVLMVVATFAAELTLPLVNRVPMTPTAGAPWFQDIGTLGIVAAVLVWRGLGVLLAVTGASALTAVDRALTTSQNDWLAGAQDGGYVFLLAITFAALGLTALAAGRAIDAAADESVRAAAAAAIEAAREREQVRVNLLVHDRVLATLLTAARDAADSAELAQSDAARALADLQALLEPDEAGFDLTSEEFVWSLQAATTESDPDAVFGYELDAPESRWTPEPVEAITSAVEEALRNSLRHAGAANRTVHVRIAADGVHVDVLDDGRGFDPATVPPERLGISESILGRMRALDGGQATIVSRLGVGTRVVLRYRAGRS